HTSTQTHTHTHTHINRHTLPVHFLSPLASISSLSLSISLFSSRSVSLSLLFSCSASLFPLALSPPLVHRLLSCLSSLSHFSLIAYSLSLSLSLAPSLSLFFLFLLTPVQASPAP